MKKKCVQTPCIIQNETVDCGAVALAIVLAYYGCFVPIEELRTRCNISRNGAHLSNIANAAQYFGLHASCVEVVSQEDLNLSFPMILFWKQRHFVVLEGFKKGKVYINDPQKGRYTITYALFTQCYSQKSLQFALMSQFKKRKKENAVYRMLSKLYQTRPAAVSLLLLSAALSTALNVVNPILSKIYIDHYLTSQSQWFLSFFIIMFLFLCGHVGVNFIQQKILRSLEQGYAYYLSHVVMSKLLKLSASFFTYRRAGELCSLPKSVQLLSMTITGPVFLAFTSTLQSFVYLGMMLYFNLKLALMAAIFSGFNLAFLARCHERIKSSSSLVQRKMIELGSLVSGYVVNILSIKATGNEEFFVHRCEQSIKEQLKEYHKLSITSAIAQSINLVLTMVGYILTTGAGIWLLSNRKISLGDLMAFNMLFFAFNQSLLQLLKLKNRFHLIEFHDQKIKEVTQSRYTVTSGSLKELNLNDQFQGKIEVIDLTFGYDKTLPPLFDKLNLEIKPYSKTAIIGSSGSGKTTLIHLISGIYQPWSGMILIDGIPINSLSPDARCKLIGVVSQEQFFFRGSIKENLCLWSNEYSFEEILDATRDASVKACIDQFEDGVNFQLTDGATNLSGGQRQRLEIARTLLTRPKVLILDEATSAVDPFIEMQLYANLFNKKMTLISVAHRLNTIKNADQIFILNQGKLVDEGTPYALSCKKSTHYLKLFCLNS